MSHNTDAVKAMYESFGKGDVPAILARLAPDGSKILIVWSRRI